MRQLELSKSYSSTPQSQKGFGFCWFLFPGARPNKSWMSHSTRLFQHLIRTPFQIAERNMSAVTAKLSKENNVFNVTY